ncbi:MAG: tail fiber domain-containing protein [bacterium]|nr:tail fiber domain-containing protein [bacterium]
MTLFVMFLVLYVAGTADLTAETAGDDGFKPVADVNIGSNGINFLPKVEYAQLVLTVSAPNGAVFKKTFDPGSSPFLELSDNQGNYLTDGSYTYELRVIPVVSKMSRTSGLDAGLEVMTAQPVKPVVQSGAFMIRGSKFVTSSAPEMGISKPLDQVILDDLIVDGSACIGQDCVNGESFGFDTLRLKENNLRIKFQDTSSSASFPSNDWQLTANDSSNGGANKFSIDDIDGGRTPFTIEAGAPSHSLYVDDGGRLGLGTSTPVTDIHVVSGNTPTLRLEQNGSSGFTPQTWDVAGNEANFFVRDVTNGSKLPFKIKPSAPTNSLYVDAAGDVALGTASPTTSFDVYRSGENAGIRVRRIDGSDEVNFKLNVTNALVQIGAKSNHPVNFVMNNSAQMVLDTDGDFAIGNTTADYKLQVWNDAQTAYGYSDGGAWATGSSREFKENIEVLTTEEALTALDELSPVKFNYKKVEDDAHVGFIAEEVPDLVAVKNRDAVSAMDVVAVLTKVVKEQQKTINELKKEITEIKNK